MYCPRHGLEMLCISETHDTVLNHTEREYVCREGYHLVKQPHDLVLILEDNKEHKN